MKTKHGPYVALFIFITVCMACSKNEELPPSRDYMQAMKDFVQDLSSWAKSQDPGFLVFAQNAHDLISTDGHPASFPDLDYLSSLDGIGRDKLYYGYFNMDQESPFDIQSDWAFMLRKASLNKYPVFVTDYCSTPAKVDTAYARNTRNGFISFSTGSYNLNILPSYPLEPWNSNNKFITKPDSVRNFLVLTETSNYTSKTDFIDAVKATNYDLLIADPVSHGQMLESADLELLKQKQNGGLRLVLASISIGQAEDQRYYWLSEWDNNPPVWLREEDPQKAGNFNVAYWESNWQSIIYGNSGSYLQRVMDAGFDGVCLQNLEAYLFFEKYGE